MNDHIPDVTKMINQWTNGTEILNVKPNGDFELGNGVDPLVALGQLAKAFMQQQDRIKRLEEELMDTKNKYAVLVADVALNEDRAERIKQLEDAGDKLHWAWMNPFDPAGETIVENWTKAKEAKL